MSVILACEQMSVCMLPSIFSPGDGFMYMMGLSSSNESVKVDTNKLVFLDISYQFPLDIICVMKKKNIFI